MKLGFTTYPESDTVGQDYVNTGVDINPPYT